MSDQAKVINANQPIVYFIVRGSLNLSEGTLAMKCATALHMLIQKIEMEKALFPADTDPDRLPLVQQKVVIHDLWKVSGADKHALVANEEQWQSLINNLPKDLHYVISTASFSNQEKEIDAVIATFPQSVKDVPMMIKSLNTLN